MICRWSSFKWPIVWCCLAAAFHSMCDHCLQFCCDGNIQSFLLSWKTYLKCIIKLNYNFRLCELFAQAKQKRNTETHTHTHISIVVEREIFSKFRFVYTIWIQYKYNHHQCNGVPMFHQDQSGWAHNMKYRFNEIRIKSYFFLCEINETNRAAHITFSINVFVYNLKTGKILCMCECVCCFSK